MFSIGCLKFLDSFNFLAMPVDQMAEIYRSKSKTFYPYDHFGLDSYNEVLSNLNIEDFKSSFSLSLSLSLSLSPSLSYKLQTQEVDIFNKDISHKTGKDLTIEYLQNDVEMLETA